MKEEKNGLWVAGMCLSVLLLAIIIYCILLDGELRKDFEVVQENCDLPSYVDKNVWCRMQRVINKLT